MVTDRVTLRENEEAAEAPVASNAYSEVLSSRSSDVRSQPSESTVATQSTAPILNGFSLEDRSTATPARGSDRGTAPAGGPDAPPAPPRDGTTPPRDGRDGPVQPPAPRDGNDRPNKLADTLKQLLGDLMKGPLGDILREVGRQLVSGNFDFNRLQDMAKNIRLDDQQVQKIGEQLNQFTDALREKTGIDVQVNLGNKPGKPGVRVQGLRMAQAGGLHNFNASVYIPTEGTPQGRSEFVAGYAGPSVQEMSPEEAAQEVRNAALDRRFARS